MKKQYSFRKLLSVYAILACVGLLPVAATAGVIFQGGGLPGNARVISVTGITILGSTYDATFTPNVNYLSLGANPISFTTLSDAQAAVTAINAEILAGGFDGSASGLTLWLNYFVPISVSAIGGVFNASSNLASQNPLSYGPGLANLFQNDVPMNQYQAWVTFTPAVPEPSGLLGFLTAGSLGLFFLRRRR